MPVISNWNQFIEKLQVSPQEFYSTLQQSLQSRNIPQVSFSTVFYSESMNIMSDKREYFRVARSTYVFEICCAPFGNGMFVSWWYINKPSILTRILSKVGWIAALMNIKTFYQLDTQNMYMHNVRLSVLEVIDKMTNEKGLRGLTELERLPQYNSKR